MNDSFHRAAEATYRLTKKKTSLGSSFSVRKIQQKHTQDVGNGVYRAQVFKISQQSIHPDSLERLVS